MTDAHENTETIALGDLVLPVRDFSLTMETASVRRGYADGSQRIILLGEKPVMLECGGAVDAEDAGLLPALLRNAMAQHTAYHFVLAGCRFLDMRLMRVSCTCNDSGRTAHYALLLCGRISEVENSDNPD